MSKYIVSNQVTPYFYSLKMVVIVGFISLFSLFVFQVCYSKFKIYLKRAATIISLQDANRFLNLNC